MIIKDFTDNDLYKFTTMNAIQKKFPDAEVVYRFVNRGETDFPSGFAEALQAEVEEMRGLTLTDEAERFMRRKCYYFDSVFFDLLKGYRFDPSEVRILQNGGSLELEIRGLWYRTVLWEVPLMAMISELYFQILCVALSIPFIFSAYLSGLTIQKRALATFFHSKVKVSEYVISDKFVFPYWQSARAEILKRCDFRDFSKELDSVRKCRFEKTKDGKKELSFALGYWGAVFSFGIEGAQDIEESNLYFNNSGFLLPCGKSGEKEFISANFKSTSDGGWSASAKIYVYRGGKIIKNYQSSGDELIKKVAAAEAHIDEIRAMWRANSQRRK